METSIFCDSYWLDVIFKLLYYSCCERQKSVLTQFIIFVTDAENTIRVNGTISEQIQSINIHDLQIYGIVVTILLCFIVFGGVKMINRVAPAFLVPVLFSIFCIFVGVFLAKKDDPASKLLTSTHTQTLSLGVLSRCAPTVYSQAYLYISHSVCLGFW